MGKRKKGTGKVRILQSELRGVIDERGHRWHERSSAPTPSEALALFEEGSRILLNDVAFRSTSDISERGLIEKYVFDQNTVLTVYVREDRSIVVVEIPD